MIRHLASAVSALVFLLGCLVMVAAAAVAWVTVIVMACVQWGWPFGAVLLVGSFFLMARYEAHLKAPWVWWCELWGWADNGLRERLK